ncbi:hypothetical protein G6F35_012160 [Rhizopus arrhizus]|nr:hypothetical protein G6F35_012160 [Rhizopus arrhizus]
MQAMMLEPVDREAALRWYEAAAAQGYEDAIERLRQLREQPALRMLAVFAVEFLSLFYLGTLKDEAVLGAVGFGSMTQFTITSVCIGVTVGGAALVSRALGSGNARRARTLAGASLILMAGSAVAAGAIFLAAIGPFTAAIGLAEDVRGHLLSYVLITTPFAVVMGVGRMLSNLLRAAGHGRQSMWVLLAGTATTAQAAEPFAACLSQLRGPALKAGVSGATFDTHTAGLAPDMAVIDLLDAQPEFKTPIWDYMAGLVDDERVADGQAGMARWQSELDRAASRYGVDPATIAAVWGVESNFGRTLGGRPLISAANSSPP